MFTNYILSFLIIDNFDSFRVLIYYLYNDNDRKLKLINLAYKKDVRKYLCPITDAKNWLVPLFSAQNLYVNSAWTNATDPNCIKQNSKK